MDTMQELLANLLTAKEAAELLGTNDSRIRQLIAEGRLAAIKKGNEWIIYKPSVEQYIKTKSPKGRPGKGTRTKVPIDKN